MAAERIKVGQRYMLTYEGIPDLSVEAFILHEQNGADLSRGVWVPLTALPAATGHHTVYTAPHLFLVEGYHHVSYRTDPPGGEQVVKIYAFRTDPTNRAAGTITSTATSRVK